MSLLSSRPAVDERDPDALALRFRNNWQEIKRVEPAPASTFATRTGRVRTDAFALIEMDTTGLALEVAQSRFVMISLPGASGLSIRSGRRRWEIGPGGGHFCEGRPFEIDYGRGYRGHAILVEKRAFRRAAEEAAGEPLPTSAGPSGLLSPKTLRALGREIAALEAEVGRASLAGEGETLSSEIEARFLEAILSDPGEGGHLSAANRAALGRAVDYIRANYAEPFSAVQLARAAGSHVRGLQLAFRRRYGASPWQYLLMCRLEAVHSRLREPAGRTKVTEAAVDAGFTHLGEFGRLYRQRYGERPIDTRRRAAPGDGNQAPDSQYR